MATSTSILQKVQQAIRNYLRHESQRPSWLSESQIVSGISRGALSAPDEDSGQDVSVPLPRIIVDCRTAEHSAPFSGVFRAAITVRLEESADDTDEDTHLLHSGEVIDLLFTDTIATDISVMLADFRCFGFVLTSQSYDLAGRKWTAVFNFEAEVVGADVD